MRSVPTWSHFPVTMALIVASVLVGFLTKLGVESGSVDFLYFNAAWGEMTTTDTTLAAVDPFHAIKGGEVWRLVTPIFLHFGAMHLVFNMLSLGYFGRVVESTLGSPRFLLLVVGIAVISNVAQALASGPGFGGMSGVVYGLLGFVFMRSRYHPMGGHGVHPQVVIFMLIWLVAGFAGSLDPLGPMANGAHLAGLAAGVVFGALDALCGGAWANVRRRRQFQRALAERDDLMHRCAVCGKSERDDPSLEFRVSGDGEEYCLEHLPPKT